MGITLLNFQIAGKHRVEIEDVNISPSFIPQPLPDMKRSPIIVAEIPPST